jgi:hypothetical protein
MFGSAPRMRRQPHQALPHILPCWSRDSRGLSKGVAEGTRARPGKERSDVTVFMGKEGRKRERGKCKGLMCLCAKGVML